MTGLAPTYDLSSISSLQLAGIEYPGPVRSVPAALSSIGGLPSLSQSLCAPPSTIAPPIELNLDPTNPFFHSIPATTLDSANVLVRVVKRKRKRPRLDEHGKIVETGVFTLKPVGIVEKTVRFRGMADFQFTPKVSRDPVIDVAAAIKNLDVATITSFDFPEPDEAFPEAYYLPPPSFSKQTLPFIYDYKSPASSVQTTVTRPSTGEEYQRLANIARLKTGSHIMSIAFADKKVPQEPGEEQTKHRSTGSAELEKKLLALMEIRPVWTRTGMLNQLTEEEARVAINTKGSVALVSWTFSDGPFRELCIKWGYDPRKDPEARFYQRLTFRNIDNPRRRRLVVKPKETKEAQSRFSHTFDGKTVHSKVGNFQLIDITDPLSKTLIDSSAGVLSTCSFESEGWYDPDYFEQIRQVVRRKFIGIDTGHTVRDEDCQDLLGDPKEVDMSFNAGRRKGKKAVNPGSGSESGGGAGKGSDDASDNDEGEDGENRSGSEAPKQTKKPKRKTIKKPAWELSKKRAPKAKKKDTDETAEETAARLRRVIGIPVAVGRGKDGSAPAGPSASGEDEEESGSGSDADDV